jgi:hypothetical protein
MSNATADVSSPNSAIIRAETRRSISTSSSWLTAAIASQNRRWSSTRVGTLTNRSAAVVAHQSAKPSFEHGSTTRFSVANARYVPTLAPAPERRAPTTSSTIDTSPSRCSTPHTAATSPKARCRVRSGSDAASRASNAAAMSVAEPR